MESDRRALLNQILEYHFACIELNLYLDNNPDDEDAYVNTTCILKNSKMLSLNMKIDMDH